MFSSDLSREAVKYDERLLLSLEGKRSRPRTYVHASALAKGVVSSCQSVSQPCPVSTALMKV